MSAIYIPAVEIGAEYTLEQFIPTLLLKTSRNVAKQPCSHQMRIPGDIHSYKRVQTQLHYRYSLLLEANMLFDSQFVTASLKDVSTRNAQKGYELIISHDTRREWRAVYIHFTSPVVNYHLTQAQITRAHARVMDPIRARLFAWLEQLVKE